MMASLSSAWAGRSVREQRLLLVMAALALVVILWLLVIRPLGDASSAARERLDRAVVAQGRILSRTEAISAARRSAPPVLNTTLDVAVGAAATAAGFELARVDLQGSDRLGIAITTARAPALFGWIAGLAQRGIFVERMTLRPNPDATLSVDATLAIAR